MHAARVWAGELQRCWPEIVRIGLFGSYVRDAHAPGSDLDVVMEVSSATHSRRADRAAKYLPDVFPVGLDLFVYTSAELARARAQRDPWIAGLDGQVTWLE
jgi:predicted nucleotidyltransferase